MVAGTGPGMLFLALNWAYTAAAETGRVRPLVARTYCRAPVGER
jgi:hypothetical protein